PRATRRAVHPPAFPGALPPQLHTLRLKPLLLGAMCDERFRERADLFQLVVGFPRREVARHPTPMIRASWSPVNDSSNDALPGMRCRRLVSDGRAAMVSCGALAY